MNTSLDRLAIFTFALSLALSACSKAPTPTAVDPGATPSPASPAAPIDQPAEDVPPATAPSSTGAPSAQGGDLERMDGYGDLRFGMSADEAKKAWGGDLAGAPGPDSSCYRLTPKWVKVPTEFSFMVEAGKFVRYDTTLAKGTAPGGGKVGMSTDQIKTLYGAQLQQAPHKYVEGGHTLAVQDAAGGAGKLVFETDAKGVVTAWRVGVPPQVDYVEGCS